MNKEFVEYEEALDLKELGFNEPCFASYNNEGEFKDPFNYSNGSNGYLTNSSLKDPKNFNALTNPRLLKDYLDNPFIAAPIYQQAFKWFREKHGLYYYILPEFYKNGINFNWQILWYLPKEEWTNYRIYNGTMLYGDNGEYPTQEEADIACLKKLIEIVKNK